MQELTSVDWSRAQFALTALYHFLFVPLTLGLSFIVAFMESLYVATGKQEWLKITKFWLRLFGINFVIGVTCRRLWIYGNERNFDLLEYRHPEPSFPQFAPIHRIDEYLRRVFQHEAHPFQFGGAYI